MHSIQTLIIGGGIAGTSLACALAESGAGAGTAIVDIDVFGKYGSSELNGGGVRCTFAEPINIRISLESTKYYLQHAKKLDFLQRGYFWMYDQRLWEESRRFLPVVRSFGLPVEELRPGEIQSKFPMLSDVSDLAGATFTPFDGRLSPHRLRMHYLEHAQVGGVQVLDRCEVVAIEGAGATSGPPFVVRMLTVPPRQVRLVLSDVAATPNGPREELVVQAQRIVNAAGPWAKKLAALYGDELVVTPLPRQVYLLKHPQLDLESQPFFLDYPQDIYFRHYEWNHEPTTLVSWSDPAESPRIDFTSHGKTYYEQYVKHRLAKRISAMAEAELVGGWVGHYELSPDKGAIVGEVPGRDGVYNYNGLSAHGVMQSRALGVALAEKLMLGRWPSQLNLDGLQEARFGPRNLLAESMYV